MPTSLASPCKGSPIHEGQNAKAALAKSLVDFSQCKAKHRDTVGFYASVKSKFDKKPERRSVRGLKPTQTQKRG